MKYLQSLLHAAALCLLAAQAAPSFAHGEPTHAKPKAAAVKEQKAWGIAGEAKAARRTVVFRMTDTMRFTPDKLRVKQGETVKLVLKNDGKLLHEFVLGTRKDLDEHAALMVKFPNMEHDEPHMAHVPPGKTGQIVWTFNRVGEFDFACLIAGHYSAGMVGQVTVVARPPAARTVGAMQAVPWADTALVAQTDADMVDGEVRKVDKENNKLTLKHSDIKNLDMPAMTMVFTVKEPALLDKLKAGDKVKFKAEKINGTFTVTAIQPAP